MTFRQKFVIAVLCFVASAVVVGQLPYLDLWEALGLMWDLATGVLLPLTVAGILIVGLLLYWNPTQGHRPS